LGYLADRTMTGDALTAIRSPPRRTRWLPSRLTAARAEVTARTEVGRDGFQYTRFTPPEYVIVQVYVPWRSRGQLLIRDPSSQLRTTV
jgi:hypothetical protein